MECPNCKKTLADNAKTCPECGFDFSEQEQKKSMKMGCIGLIIICFFLAVAIGSCTNDAVDEMEANKPTQEDITKAENFITTLEAAGLIKEIKNQCADGSKGCYRLIIDEYLWTNTANYQTKEDLVYASDIYFHSKTPYKHFEGIGYNSGKVLFDMWGIKNK